jgi:retron-type reverse transcriptase
VPAIKSSFGKLRAEWWQWQGVVHRNLPLPFMAKKFRNLYDQIYDWDNLLAAYREARRGKTYSSSFLRFKDYHLTNLRHLQLRLIEGSWKPDAQLEFDIIDPKKRTIACQSFRDRVLHHALIQVVGPILDAAMMPQVFACRVGLGTHKCVTRMQQLMRQNPDAWVLHVDFSKFFPTIPQDLLLAYLSKKLTCRRTLLLIKQVLSVQASGLPIGALTSQCFCNYWGGKLDRFVAATASGRFVRYMDDAAIIVDSKAKGLALKQDICAFVATEMDQRIGKWHLGSVARGVTFCGFRIRCKYKLIKRQSMIRQRRKLRHLLAHGDHEGWRRSQIAFMGHIRHADGQNGLTCLGLAISC